MDRISAEQLFSHISSHTNRKKDARKYREFVAGNISVATPNDAGNIGSNEFINYGEITRNRKLGYMFGHPFRISHKSKNRVQEMLSEVMAHNDFSHLTSATGREMMDVGRAYWLIYLDEKGRLKIKVRPVEEIILINEDDLSEGTYAGIRHYMKYNPIAERESLYVEVYYRDVVEYYIQDKTGRLILDPYNPVSINPFGYVPIVEFKNNNDESDHKSIYGMTILYNRIFNHGADEMLEIGNSYFKFINGDLPEDVVEKFKQAQALINKRILILEQGDDGKVPDAEIMNKNSDNSTFENFLDYMRKRILELAPVPDYESISANNSDTSAKAMVQRLRPMEDFCKVKEDNIRTALRYFIRIFIRYAEMLGYGTTELKDYDIQFKRNSVDTLFIENMNDFITLKSSNLFSEDFILSLLPFVSDPHLILEMRDKEREKALGMDYMNSHEEA